MAILGGSLANSAFAFIGQRQGTYRKVMMWLLVHAYICLCLLFCTTLIANVLESELREWSSEGHKWGWHLFCFWLIRPIPAS